MYPVKEGNDRLFRKRLSWGGYGSLNCNPSCLGGRDKSTEFQGQHGGKKKSEILLQQTSQE
jgi:hypothetical protein